MIPNSLKVFFWDVDVDSFDPHAYPEYTIERILELGDSKAVRWLEDEFSVDQITNAIRTNRRLTPRSANFWALVYHIPGDEVSVLR